MSDGHEGHGHGAGGHGSHGDESTTAKKEGEHAAHAEGEIHMTKEQIKTIKIKFGDFSEVKINDFIQATGHLGLPPNAYSSANAKANGFIKESKKYVEGDYIKKGSLMAYLENPEFIEHQREYLEVAAELTYLYQELQRQKALVDANAGILKNIQKLQSEVSMKAARKKGIAKQLSYWGIDVANLTAETIVDRISIIAPMSGYITSLKMHNGMYVEPQLELMEIVNENHLHLELDIFEQDIGQVKKGQRISYTVPALGNAEYKGEVHILGKEFNQENKTVRIHGHLEKKRPRFIKDLFIEAKIWLNDQTVQALPEKAIIKIGASSYIYVADMNAHNDEVVFKAISVLVGGTENGFTSVKLIDKKPEKGTIVTEGAYYVYAQSVAGELEHSH